VYALLSSNVNEFANWGQLFHDSLHFGLVRMGLGGDGLNAGSVSKLKRIVSKCARCSGAEFGRIAERRARREPYHACEIVTYEGGASTETCACDRREHSSIVSTFKY
jgi:hypothetical protein